jgi:hypothetical protein
MDTPTGRPSLRSKPRRSRLQPRRAETILRSSEYLASYMRRRTFSHAGKSTGICSSPVSQLDKSNKATHRHSLSTLSFCGPFLFRTGPYAIVIVIGIEMDLRVTAVVLHFHLHVDLVPESCSECSCSDSRSSGDDPATLRQRKAGAVFHPHRRWCW